MKHKIHTNAILVFSFFMCVSFYTPIFASFFQTKQGFSGGQITILFALGSIAAFLFEIPTGVLGDKIGERESLMIGSCLTAVSTLLFIFGNMPLIYVGEIIFGMASTFFSGPFDAMLYQYCKNKNGPEDYGKIISKSYSLQWLALCVSFGGCSLLSQSGNLALPFYATVIANILAFISALYLPKIKKNENNDPIAIFSLAIDGLKKNQRLRNICLLNAWFTMLLVSGYQLLQPYLSGSDLDTSYNGFVYCIAALLASCGSFCFHKVQALHIPKKILLGTCFLLISCCYLGLAMTHNVLLVAGLICGYRLIWGITSPIFSYIVNNCIPSDAYRDTVFSVISLISNLMGSVFLMIIGLVDLPPNMTYYALAFIVILLCPIILSRDFLADP